MHMRTKLHSMHGKQFPICKFSCNLHQMLELFNTHSGGCKIANALSQEYERVARRLENSG